jgi:hypothetical protein
MNTYFFETYLKVNRRILFAMSVLLIPIAGCALTSGGRSETPFLVEYHAASGTQEKRGLQALTDSGVRLFAKSTLDERNGGNNSFGGTVKFPNSVQVTWRENITGDYWTTGTVIGNYRVEVMSRIPEEVFKAVNAAPQRAIKLHFLVKDNGVLLAWSIEEQVKNGFRESMHGGDFKLPTRDNGKIIDPGYGWQK